MPTAICGFMVVNGFNSYSNKQEALSGGFWCVLRSSQNRSKGFILAWGPTIVRHLVSHRAVKLTVALFK